MPPTTVERPAHGGKCTRCLNGVLYLLAETAEGEYLGCFNCGTRGTVPREGDWVRSVDPALDSPTGFTVTHEQAAAQDAAGGDQDQAADRASHAGQAAQLQTDLAERDSRIVDLQRQLDEARAGGQQPTPDGGQQ